MIKSALIPLLFLPPRLISSSLFSCHLFPFQFAMLTVSLWTHSDFFLSSDCLMQRGLMVGFRAPRAAFSLLFAESLRPRSCRSWSEWFFQWICCWRRREGQCCANRDALGGIPLPQPTPSWLLHQVFRVLRQAPGWYVLTRSVGCRFYTN